MPNIAVPNGKPSNNSLPAPQPTRLPTELLQDIFSYLSPRDYESARLVCARWYAASLCKPLLLNLLAAMKFDSFDNGCPCFSTPPTNGCPDTCPDTCPCNYQFPEMPMITWGLSSLRVAFALALDKHASSVRVACGRLVLDMSTFLKNVNTDWGYPEAPRQVEILSFSEKSGSFVATVTKATTKDGRVERKLWIHRLFTSRHSPLNKIARPDDGFLFFVEGSRHLPGQLYLTMELSKFSHLPVIGLRVEEHSAFSAVRRIIVKYINGGEEEIAFSRFKPDIQNPANAQDDDTVFYDRKGITYRSNQTSWAVKQKAKGNGKGVATGLAKPKGWSWWSFPLLGEGLTFRKDVVVYKDPLQKTTAVRTSQRLLATIGDDLLYQMCFRATLPLSASPGSKYSSVIIAPNNDIFVCAPSFGSPGQNPEVVHARYKFQVPPRASEPAGSRITHLTIAPQYKYDIGSGIWWMAICAAYENGEIWMWRVDMDVLLRKDDVDSTKTDESTLVRAAPKAASKNRSCYPITRQNSVEPIIPPQNPSDFDPDIGECIAVDLCSISGHIPSESSTTKKVKVVFPPGEEFGYMRPLKLGYMPGLEALNFVGRGRTVMAGTRKEIVVWDMRMWNGFERGKLKAEF